LEDHLEISAQWPQRARAGVADVVIFEMDAAGGRLEQADDGFAKRGFPATGFADKAERFARRDV
jgi:hypothetical protein